MLAAFKARLTFANVTSSLALFVALSTGGAYAANTVFSTDIVDGEVKTADIGTDQVQRPDIQNGSVVGNKIDGGAVTTGKIGNNAVTTPKIADGAVALAKLQDGAVTSAKVLDDNVAGGGLGAGDLLANSVAQSEIATDGVGALEVQDNSIDSGEIVDFQLTNQDVGVLFAEVSGAGVLDNSSGSVTVTKLGGLGTYEVDFARNITLCTAVATVGPSGGGSAIGEINVADRGGNVEAIFVDTNNSDGAAADKPFRLVVVC